MKVYNIPEELPAPTYNWEDLDQYERDIIAHKAALKQWLIERGFKGKHTGEIAQFQVADGFAEYMLADGNPSALVHLPYGDGYSFQYVHNIPKKEILANIDFNKRMQALFTKEN